MTVCVDLDIVEVPVLTAERPSPAEAVLAPPAERPEAGRLPFRPLLGLAGSSVFAFWTSLTCFVC